MQVAGFGRVPSLKKDRVPQDIRRDRCRLEDDLPVTAPDQFASMRVKQPFCPPE